VELLLRSKKQSGRSAPPGGGSRDGRRMSRARKSYAGSLNVKKFVNTWREKRGLSRSFLCQLLPVLVQTGRFSIISI